MIIEYYGHATFVVELAGKRILFDPFFTGNPLNEGIDPASIACDLILLSHGHGDHAADAESIAKANDCRIISNYEVSNWFEAKGCDVHPMNQGGTIDLGYCKAKYVNAIHTSSMPDGSYGGNPGGFVVWGGGQSFYFAGDTALTMDMKLIPMTCPKLDIAILPIGDNFTMGYDDAALAAQFVECDQVVGCHYDTFGHIKIDKNKARQAFEAKGKILHLLEIGGSMTI